MLDNRSDSITNDTLCPKWEHTETGYAGNKTYNCDALVPCGIGKLKIVWVGNFLEQDFTDNAQNVDGRYND